MNAGTLAGFDVALDLKCDHRLADSRAADSKLFRKVPLGGKPSVSGIITAPDRFRDGFGDLLIEFPGWGGLAHEA
jgi:hypothetical protein